MIMGNPTRGLALVLILIVATSALSLLIVKPTNAQTLPTPSVPQFTVKFVTSSYSVTTTDPYTGQSTTKQYENNTIQLRIKNQPIPASAIENGSINLYYNVQTKGHFSNKWTSAYSFPSWASSNSDSLSGSYNTALPIQSNSQYTILSFPANYKSGDEIDFEVEALFAYQVTEQTYQGDLIVPIPETSFTYQSSGWSSTQTYTMPNAYVLEYLPYIIIAIIAIVILIVLVVLVFHRRHPKTGNLKQ